MSTQRNPEDKAKGKALARIWAARALSRGSPKALASNGEHRE
jgi:hypothetical protein